MKNKITDLRNHLFETLEALKDPDKPMELDRARAIAEVSRVIVDSAKVEVQLLEATGALQGTDFFPPNGEKEEAPRPKLAAASTARRS